MVDFAELWETINDKCWPIVEAVKLNDFFDENNLPPVLLPLVAVLLVAVLLFFLLGSGGPSEPEVICGNFICDGNETFFTCPEDGCPAPVAAEGKNVVVRIDETPDCSLTVKLYDSNGEFIRSQEGQKTEFDFQRIDKSSVYVLIESPYEGTQPQQTPSKTLQDDDNTFDIILSNTICEAPRASTGVLRLTIKDFDTGTTLNGVSISIAETQNGHALNYVTQDLMVNGFQDFPLPLGKTYTVYATRDGYISYNGENEAITLTETTREKSKAISMTPLADNSPDTGDLEVCARNGTIPMTHGLISVQDVSGTYSDNGEISAQSADVETTGSGCYVFEGIPAGTIVSVSMPTPPSGCIPIANPTSTIQAGKRDIVYLELNCEPENSAHLKVKIIGNDNLVLTENATLTVWTLNSLIPGTGFANSLASGDAGYSEEIVIPANTTIYVWARGLPLGYLDYKSDFISVPEGEHEAFNIYLNFTEPANVILPSAEFVFNGVSTPNIVSRNQPFNVTINEILYDQTQLNGQTATLEASIDSQLCDIYYDDIWHLDCISPNSTGDYTLMIDVKYNDLLGAYDLDVGVWEYAPGAGLITITPVFSTYGEPPLELFYDIKFNGTPIDEITNQSMSVTYTDSPNAYAGEISNLSKVQAYDYWSLDADVPYKGNYQLNMQIEIFENGVFYETSHTVSFSTTSHSSKLNAEVYLSENFLTVLDSFDVIIILTFDGRIIPSLDILEVFADNVFHSVPWEEALRYYLLPISSTSYELCNMQMSFLINGEKVTEDETVHVINTDGTKSVSCPLDRGAACSSREDMRRCVANHNDKLSYYSEEQLLTCIQSGCPFTTVPSCPSTNKGDLEPDCLLDEVDYDIMSQYLLSIKSQTDRNELVSCLDMDNDDDVDEDDLTCLKYLVSTAWYGDSELEATGEGVCQGEMKGGFCFDIDTTSPLPGDLFYSGNIDSDDEEIMQKIITAVAAGVTPDEEILDIADYNQDGTIDNTDLTCLQSFMTVNFETGDVLSTSSQVSTACMPIFGFDCKGTQGDLDGNGIVSETDFVMVRLMAQGQLEVISGVEECADINGDDIIDESDEECMQAYFTGDQEAWLICLDCPSNTPVDAYGEEICHDGYDNNCDGLTDKEDERCECGPGTPCDMKWDADAGSGPGVSDGNYKVCRDVDWDMSDWKWFTEEEIACNTERQCGAIICGETISKCSSTSGTKGELFEVPEYCCYTAVDGYPITSYYRTPVEWTHDYYVVEAHDSTWTACLTPETLSRIGYTCESFIATLSGATYFDFRDIGITYNGQKGQGDIVYPPQGASNKHLSWASESYYLPPEQCHKWTGRGCGDGWDNNCYGGDTQCC